MIRYRALWSDGYYSGIIQDNGLWRLEGNRRTFSNIELLETYYKGKIKTMVRE